MLSKKHRQMAQELERDYGGSPMGEPFVSESESPPTDKALAVMTRIEELIQIFRDATIRYAQTEVFKDSRRYDMERAEAGLLREIKTLVDHPERLAGEDEVVVKREELQKSVEMLRDLPVSRYGNARLTLILAWMEGWLAGSPTAQESTNG